MQTTIITLLLCLTWTLTFSQEENEPWMEEIYFTDQAGERITGSVSYSDKFVYLNIVSKRAIGEVVKITMDKDEEYFYKKKFLSEGSFIKIPIKADLEQVKLIIYNPTKKKHVKRRRKQMGEGKAKDAVE